MEHHSPERLKSASPEKTHATEQRPVDFAEVDSPPGSRNSSDTTSISGRLERPDYLDPHPYRVQHVNVPAQSPDGRYNELPRPPMQNMPLTSLSYSPAYPWRQLPMPVPTSCLRTGIWRPFGSYTADHHPLTISELLNPLPPEPKKDNPTESFPQPEESLDRQERQGTQVSIAGDTTQSEVSEETMNSTQMRRERSERSSSRSLPRSGRQKATQIATFTEVAAHTAKCDECNHRNTDGMSRCNLCGWQCCRKCLGNRGQNKSHVSSTGHHVASETESPSRAEEPQLSHTSSTASSPNTPTVRGHLSPITPATLTSSLGFESPGDPADKAEEKAQQEVQRAAHTLIGLSNNSGLRGTNSGSSPLGPYWKSTGGEFACRQGYRKRAHEQAEIADDDDDDDATVKKEKRLRIEEDLDYGYLAIGEEFENPRRNPSRRARPIDMKE